ncbi:MAG: hypothetical protein ACLQVM_16305 [Terriglobia bacterium]
MSLRKAPQFTPDLLAATRQNAQHSTKPRRPAAKQNAKLSTARTSPTRISANPCSRWASQNTKRFSVCWKRMGNMEEASDSDISSEHSQTEEALGNLEMKDRRGNVYENKGSSLENAG